MIVGTWALAVFGRHALRHVAPLVAIFMLAVPFWELLVPALQGATIAANRLLLAASGIDAEVRGDTIRLAAGTLQVAGSCSGLNYFMAGLTVGSMYAYLIPLHRAARAAVIASAAGIAILSNWIRVFGLVVIGHVTAMRSPLMEDHATYGWVLFALSLLAFFAVARRLERWGAPSVSAARDPSRGAHGLLSLSAGQGPPPSGRSRRRGLLLLAAATGIGASGPLLFLLLDARPAPATVSEQVSGIHPDRGWIRAAVDTVPPAHRVAPAAARPSAGPSTSWHSAFLGADVHRVEHWRQGDAEVRVDRLVYLRQDQGKELIGNGNRIAPAIDLVSDRLIGPLDADARTVRQAVVRTAEGGRLVWYWYHVAGTDTPSAARAKVYELLAVFRGRSASELVAASAPCGPTDCAAAARLLQALIAGASRPRAIARPETTPAREVPSRRPSGRSLATAPSRWS